MAIFNSQAINTDPNPYQLVNLSGGVIGRVHEPLGALLLEDRYRPRREFDNSPNPLLVEFRRVHSFVGWGMWIMLASEAMEAEGLATREHYQHARKVLARLAAVTTAPLNEAS